LFSLSTPPSGRFNHRTVLELSSVKEELSCTSRAILGHGGALLHVIVVALQTQPTNLVVPSLSRAAVAEPPFLIEPLVAIL